MLVRLVGGVAATRRAAATRRSDASCRASLTPQTHVSKSRSDKPRLLRILYFFDASTCRSDSSDFGREKSRPRRSTPPTERVTGRVACCGARHPTGALMSLSDTICQELARAHHENLTALKERSWLNPNLSHTAVRPGSGTGRVVGRVELCRSDRGRPTSRTGRRVEYAASAEESGVGPCRGDTSNHG